LVVPASDALAASLLSAIAEAMPVDVGLTAAEEQGHAQRHARHRRHWIADAPTAIVHAEDAEQLLLAVALIVELEAA